MSIFTDMYLDPDATGVSMKELKQRNQKEKDMPQNKPQRFSANCKNHAYDRLFEFLQKQGHLEDYVRRPRAFHIYLPAMAKVMGYDYEDVKQGRNQEDLIKFLFGDYLDFQHSKLNQPTGQNVYNMYKALEDKVMERIAKESEKSLPEDLDYKLVVGYEGSQSAEVIIFSKKLFELTGSEYEAEVFRVTVRNNGGKSTVIVEEGKDKTMTIIEAVNEYLRFT